MENGFLPNVASQRKEAEGISPENSIDEAQKKRQQEPAPEPLGWENCVGMAARTAC